MAGSIYDFEVRQIDGQQVPLERFKGQVLLIVNTASQCGFTPQFGGLEDLYERYRERGFAVLGFPSNQFGNQDPGSNEEIGAFCQKNYGVTFPVFAKIEVNGPNAHPLFRYLCHDKPGILGTEAIKWNFTKVLVDRDGEPVSRHAPRTPPEELDAPIRNLL